jgi:hypothetical protein
MNSIYKRHNYWIKLAKMFGEVDFPEDAVQDCYIKLYDYENVSDAFFSTALHHMIMDNHRKKKLDLIPIIDSIDKEEVEEVEDTTDILLFIDTWHWYDKRIYLEYIKEKTSLRKFAKKYDYDYQIIYRTLKKCNLKLLQYGKKKN